MVSLRMIHVLRQYADHLTVLVPLECVSAGTMLALGANAIKMGPLGHLSAVDTSVTHEFSPVDRDNQRVKVSHDGLNRAARLFQGDRSWDFTNAYDTLFRHVHPLVVGAVDRAERSGDDVAVSNYPIRWFVTLAGLAVRCTASMRIQAAISSSSATANGASVLWCNSPKVTPGAISISVSPSS